MLRIVRRPFNPGDVVTASWSFIAHPTSTDWIGLCAADTAYLAVRYTNGTAGGTRISPSLRSPQLCLYANGGYIRLATSNSVTVQ